MFRFFTGLVLGFLGVWLFSGGTTAELKHRAREMGRTAQQKAQNVATETKTSTQTSHYRPTT